MDARHRHAHRFRKVSIRHARPLAERFDGDTQAITGVDDDVVTATVDAWKKAQGLRVIDRHIAKRV
jgi:hypothetical protein